MNEFETKIAELEKQIRDLKRQGVFADTFEKDTLSEQVTGKTLVQVIHELLVIHAAYGNCEVQLLGCYQSTGDIEEIEFVPADDKNWHNKHPLVVFASDICSG